MKYKHYNVIIIGAGMSGLFSALQIKKLSPKSSFLVLEKNSKKMIGGRAGNNIFYGTKILIGAGIGRKDKDKLLYKLLKEFNFKINKFQNNPIIHNSINKVDINKIIKLLRQKYKRNIATNKETFKEFAQKVLGKEVYKNFVLSSGYSDYEKEDIKETLYYYGMDDNACCSTGFSVPWHELVIKMYKKIGEKRIKFSQPVTKIVKKGEIYNIYVAGKLKYTTDKIIIGTPIDQIKNLLHKKIYNDVVGQPFIRLYAKFDKKSSEIMKSNIKGFTFVKGPLQKIVPINPSKGVYMIVYNDNKNALKLKKYISNNPKNRVFYQNLLEKTLGISKKSLKILAIKGYYWKIGTHYYKPLNTALYSNRKEFIHTVQHPEKNILVVGEGVSRNQGWTEGALQSVKAVVTKDWLKNEK